MSSFPRPNNLGQELDPCGLLHSSTHLQVTPFAVPVNAQIRGRGAQLHMHKAQPRPVSKQWRQQDHPLHRGTLGSRLLGKANRAESHVSEARDAGARTGTQMCPLRGPPGRGAQLSSTSPYFPPAKLQFLPSLCPVPEAHLMG